jgi:hypothetical protein
MTPLYGQPITVYAASNNPMTVTQFFNTSILVGEWTGVPNNNDFISFSTADDVGTLYVGNVDVEGNITNIVACSGITTTTTTTVAPTTTTTTAASSNCESYNLTISGTDLSASYDNTVWVDYYPCGSDTLSDKYFTVAGTYANNICVNSFAIDPNPYIYYYTSLGGSKVTASNSSFEIAGFCFTTTTTTFSIG